MAPATRMAPKHFLDVTDWSRPQIEQLLLRARFLFEERDKNFRLFQGFTQFNLFFEPSTRTQASFELAGKRLGLDVINLAVQNSSLKKGETLYDTARSLQAMGADVLVIRHSASGAAAFFAHILNCCVINAGDGIHAHPSQALLDALTLMQCKGKIEGLVIALCGDVLHSRVARSHFWLLQRLGARLRCIAPSLLTPPALADFGVECFTSMEEGLKGADVVMCLRLQQERMKEAFIPSLREYAFAYRLDEEKLRYAKPDCLVMHPGPMNRGVEISTKVAHSAHSVIEKQVQSGVAMRMAMIEALLKPSLKKEAAQ